MTVSEAMELLKISRQAICKLLRKGHLKGSIVGGKWEIDPQSIKYRLGVTPKEAGRICHLSQDTIRWNVRKGNIKAKRIGERWYIDIKSLNSWKKERSIKWHGLKSNSLIEW